MMERDEALASLKSQFEESLDRCAKDGMVDVKLLCNGRRDVSTHEIIWTLNNALRQVASGHVAEHSAETVGEILRPIR